MKHYAMAIGGAILTTVLVLALLQVLRDRNIDPVQAIARMFRPGALGTTAGGSAPVAGTTATGATALA